jgi:predicted transcriptional regulator
MPTSIHVPEPLLKAIDRKARALRISRNQLVLRALEREVKEHTGWSAEFFEQMRNTGPELAVTVADLLKHVKKARRSKPPRQF